MKYIRILWNEKDCVEIFFRILYVWELEELFYLIKKIGLKSAFWSKNEKSAKNLT